MKLFVLNDEEVEKLLERLDNSASEVHLDGIERLTLHDYGLITRCKNLGCKEKSQIQCQKCKVAYIFVFEECNMEDEEDDDFGSDGWDEMEADNSLADCLFCGLKFKTIDEAVSHCLTDHNFDLVALKARHKMDCYSFIKMVNYIRTCHPKPEIITECKNPLWIDDSFMKPVLADDPWLMYDFEDVEVPANLKNTGPSGGFHVNAENGRVTLSELHFAELQRTIQSLSAQVREKQELIDRMLDDMNKMQNTVSKIVNINGGEDVPNMAKSVATINLKEDQEYFNTYAHFGIHLEMLSDDVRTASYRDALRNNPNLVKDRTVLDLGCGTGILSMFAASAGAGKVIGIDQSDIIYHSMDILRENNLQDKVELIKGRIEDTQLPVDKVDIIVSEWMGYFLLFEAMLDSVVYSRDHHLAPGGLLMPNRCTISIVGCSNKERHQSLVGFWSDVYGYKMSCLRSEVVREPSVEVVDPVYVVTTPSQLSMLDLTTVDVNCLDFKSEFILTATKDCDLTALVGYFDVFFDLPVPVVFSTGPKATPTHWKQTVFLIKDPITMEEGDVINGELVCQRNRKEIRSLKVTITLGSMKQEYFLS